MATDPNSSRSSDNNSSSRTAPSSTSSPDSYVGCLISLTSKSEIRYEGILYNINTDESSIGLRNVRSFGTEGRKKDGPQIPPSDKFYEYILFRGSDIKDLQVKSSPPVQSTLPLNNDPAIIQSHYPRPGAAPTSLSPAVSVSLTDLSPSGQLGLSGSNYQGGLPLYQPGGNLGSWGASPSPGASGSGIGMPMYWQGYYAPQNGLAHMHQQPLLRPPTGMPIPPMQQPMQYPNYNAAAPSTGSNLPTSNLSDGQPLFPAGTSSLNVMTTSLSPSMLSSNLPAIPSATPALETLPSSMSNVAPSPSLPNASLNGSLTSPSPLSTTSPELGPVVPPVSNKANALAGQPPLYKSSPQSSASVGVSNSVRTEIPAPSLVTPSQLTQSGSTPIASSQPFQTDQKDVEVVQVSSSSLSSGLNVPVATEAQPPILPLPVPSRSTQKSNGAPFQDRYGYRGRGRGRGAGSSRPVTKFTEEFDFEAMNEKFNKDEVWGHIGKSSKSHSTDKGENGNASDEDDFQEDDAELHKIEVKPVYSKDDFFDTLSCNALDHDSHNGRTRFSEQLKIDTETFGEFARYRGGRGGRGPGRGGRSRGGYYGGYGYHGRGYGYGYGGRGRGRGRGMPSRSP